MEIHSTAVPSELNMKLWRVNISPGTVIRFSARNFRCRQGEIDIIARDRDYLVFIEVKYRRDEHEGDPAEAVDARKQARDSSYRPVLYDALSYFRGHAVPV